MLEVSDDDDADSDEKDDGTCFHMVHGGVSAVRSRTPTSAGMMGVMPDSNQIYMVGAQPKLTSQMWRSMEKEFGISNEHLLETNSYFAKHVYDIAEENARGQCTIGHSCKVMCIYYRHIRLFHCSCVSHTDHLSPMLISF